MTCLRCLTNAPLHLRAMAVALGALVMVPPAAACQQLRIAERVEDLEQRAARDSLDSQALHNLAVGYLSQNRFDAADSLFRVVISLDPQLAEAYFGLGLVQERNRAYWDGLRRRGGDSAVTRERLRREGFSRRAFLVDPFLDVRMLGAIVRRNNVPNVFAQALNAVLEGDYQAAYSRVHAGYMFNLTPAGPDSLPAFILWLHALAAARTERYAVAITDVQALLRQSMADERNDSLRAVPLRTNEFRYMLAALYQRARQNTTAIRLYEQVLENDIGNYMAHVQLARISEGERDWFNAIRQRRLAITVNPEDHTLQFDLGNVLLFTGRWAEAEEALLRARDMEPRFIRTYLALGISQMELGKTAEARTAFTHFLDIAPERYDSEIRDARVYLARLP